MSVVFRLPCASAPHMCRASSSQKSVSDPLGLELQTKQAGVQCWEPSPGTGAASALNSCNKAQDS